MNGKWKMLSAALVLAVLCLVFPDTADAQPQRWGVAVSLAPSWSADDAYKGLYSAEALDLGGTDFRIGFVRGRTNRREWGLSLVRKTISRDSTITVDGSNHTLEGSARLLGFAFHGAPILGRIGERVQIGLLIAGGVGRVQGTARLGNGTDAPARDVLRPFGKDLKAHPILDLHVTGAYLLAPGLRARVGGGFDYPGIAVFTVGLVYFHER